MSAAIDLKVAKSPRLSDQARWIARDIFKAARILGDRGSLSTGGPGPGPFNAAVRFGADRFVIGGLDTAFVVGFDGVVHEGEPSWFLQEVVEVYAAIFAAKPEATAAVHTHSPRLTAFAIAHRPLPLHYWAAAKRAGVAEIPLAEWAPRYSAKPVVDAIAAHPKAPVVLLKNRGLFGWSDKGVVALAELLNSLEETAEITIWSEILGGAKPLPDGALDAYIAQRRG